MTTASEEMVTSGGGEKGNPAKHAAILEAAKRLFFRKGYRATGMEAIAREAGVSKQTVYSHFGSKEALFEAMVRAKVDTYLVPSARPSDVGGDPETVLATLGRGFMEMILDADGMGLFRVILAESRRFPDLAATLYRAGPLRAAEGLAAYLEEAGRAGRLCVPDPLRAAHLFYAMLRGDLYMRATLNAGPVPGAAEVDRAVAEAVDAFIAAHGC